MVLLCQGFEDQQLSEITPLKVDEYVSRRAVTHSPAAVNQDIVVPRHTFVKAMTWGKALSNPVAHVKPLPASNRCLHHLSHKEVARSLNMADERLRPLLITALPSRLRRGELFTLTWQDIDFKHRIIRVVQTKSGEPREIPMSETL